MKRIPLKSGLEQDSFTGWRHMLAYTCRPKVRKKAKRKYAKRFRGMVKRDTLKRLDD